MSRTTVAMREIAVRQLHAAQRHARIEDPHEIDVISQPAAPLRRLFARQNREANQALQDFWRRQIRRYL